MSGEFGLYIIHQTPLTKHCRTMAKAKAVTGQAKFQVPGGQATPAPPVGTSLGKFGINLGQFVSQFNERTRQFNGIPIPVIVTVSLLPLRYGR